MEVSDHPQARSSHLFITQYQEIYGFDGLFFFRYTNEYIGTYSSVSNLEKLDIGKSIHWRVMELLH